jgi:hypothetical protein
VKNTLGCLGINFLMLVKVFLKILNHSVATSLPKAFHLQPSYDILWAGYLARGRLTPSLPPLEGM